MASYSLNFVNNGSGIYLDGVRRGGSLPAGGTPITIPWVENNNGGASTTTPLPGVALMAAFRAIQNDMSANGTSLFPSFYIGLTDNGSGIFSVAARRNGTPGGGGTAILGSGAASGATYQSDLFSAAFITAMQFVLNDSADGN